MKKIRISILILSIFILTIPVSSYAQICSTGHFVFDVPDSWRFMTYEDYILYNVDGGNSLFVFENDMGRRYSTWYAWRFLQDVYEQTRRHNYKD